MYLHPSTEHKNLLYMSPNHSSVTKFLNFTYYLILTSYIVPELRYRLPQSFCYTIQNLSSVTLFTVCVYVSDKHIYKILSSYNVLKLGYQPLNPYIKMCTTSPGNQ